MARHLQTLEKLIDMILPGEASLNIPSASDVNLVDKISAAGAWEHLSLEELLSACDDPEFLDSIIDKIGDPTDLLKERLISNFMRKNALIILDTYFSNVHVRSSMSIPTKPPFPSGYRIDFDQDKLTILLEPVTRKKKLFREIYE